MKNIFEILTENGIELSEEVHGAVEKAVNENYKTVAEVNKKIGKLETERDGFKERAETAETTLKNFDDIDVEAIKGELESYKQKIADAEADYNKKIYERDYKDALTAKLGGYKFSSESARKAIESEILSKELKLDNGKILGFDDVMATIKERDAAAFITEADENKARFTVPNKAVGKKATTVEEIMSIRNASERHAAIEANKELFT